MNDIWKQNTMKTVEKIFREQFFDERLCVTEDTTPADIAEWDSLAHVNLLAAIENTFNIRFTADDMAVIDSVAALLTKLVERGA
jgi:acyl carrier protein